MNRLRAQLARLGPVVAGLFVLSIAAPRAGLLYHEHPGGTRPHVHADDDGAIAELLEDHWHGHDHHHHDAEHDHDALHDHVHHHTHGHDHAASTHRTVPAPSNSAWARDDGSPTGHWHEQLRFHRALAVSAPIIPTGLFAGAAPQGGPVCSMHAALLASHARGPPSSFSLS